jgi:formylglycine-generating enzyme required for sulfatase activity
MMRNWFKLIAGLLLGAMLPAWAFAADPVVSNVRVQQRSGTKLVDIWYDLSDADGNASSVAVQVSSDNGVTFNVPASSFEGNGYGPTVTPGSNRQITWDAGADWNGQYSSKVRFRITACDSVAGMALIPAGNFMMGDTFNEGGGEERPVHQVYVSAFYMDKTEVSKALWEEVKTWATAHGYSFENAGIGKAMNHPVHTVNWYDVVKWCNARSEKEGRTPCYYTSAAKTTVYRTGAVDVANDWVNWSANGYRLPTEAEWEKAARGGLSGKRFPWGDTITHSQANYCSSSSYAYDISPTRGYHPTYATGGYPYTSPVGSFAPNGYGLYDMAGNLWEWCWDWYDGGWYSNAGATQADSKGPISGSSRLLRGGNWSFYASYCRSAFRNDNHPYYESHNFGFRCVRR